MAGGYIDAPARLVGTNGVRDDGSRRIAICQPDLETVTSRDFSAASGEGAGQEARVVADNQQLFGVEGRILVQLLRDGMRSKLDIPECERVANDPSPTRCAKFDN